MLKMSGALLPDRRTLMSDSYDEVPVTSLMLMPGLAFSNFATSFSMALRCGVPVAGAPMYSNVSVPSDWDDPHAVRPEMARMQPSAAARVLFILFMSTSSLSFLLRDFIASAVPNGTDIHIYTSNQSCKIGVSLYLPIVSKHFICLMALFHAMCATCKLFV